MMTSLCLTSTHFSDLRNCCVLRRIFFKCCCVSIQKRLMAGDGILAKMLKSTAASITLSITLLFTNLYLQGKYLKLGRRPQSFLFLKVQTLPVCLITDPTSVSNYRPISLLPVISILLERHIHYLISNHIATHYPIASQQWGFQPGMSAVSALIDVKLWAYVLYYYIAIHMSFAIIMHTFL